MTIRFDEALSRALAFARAHLAALGGNIIIVRDLLGRFRFALDADLEVPEALASELHEYLGAFSSGPTQLFLIRSAMFAPEAVFDAAELRPVEPGIQLLERWVLGADWVRAPLDRRSKSAQRLTFFGVKGGVGRSTALVTVARHLAERGERVLVLDLDLESPGISTMLLPEQLRPTFGILDWFVEGDVGQADEELLREMVIASPLSAGTRGEIRVVPAAGTLSAESYVSKLARAYASPPGGGDFATRVGRLLDELEETERPTWVLLDSRAGIDDLGAITVTRLDADALLFAMDTPQTWLAYGYLFATWRKDPTLVGRFRDRLRVVAGLVPETERAAYLERTRDHASDLFTEYLYEPDPEEEESPSAAAERFNYGLTDPDAPHSPIAVHWGRQFQGWDPAAVPQTITPDEARAAFGLLLDYVDEMIPRSVMTS